MSISSVDMLRTASGIIYAFCIFIYAEKLLFLKMRRAILYPIVGILAVLFALLAQRILAVPLLYVGMYITLFLLFRIFFDGSFMIHAFATGNFIFHLLCFKGILIAAYSFFHGYTLFTAVNNELVNIKISIWLFIIAAIFLQAFQLMYSSTKILKIIQNEKIVRMLFSIQLILNITLLFTSISYYLDDTSKWLSIYHLLISLMMLSGFYVIFQFFIRDLEAKESKENIRELQQQVSYEVKRYQSQTKYIQILRQIKHDFQNQLSGLEYVLETDGIQAGLEYIKDINKEFSKTRNVYQRYSDHTLLDALLQEYAQTCLEHQIDFNAKVIAKSINISDLHLCTLFTNLLDNAIEANLKVRGKYRRFISIDSRTSGHWAVITILNRYNGQIKEHKGTLYTTKENDGEHGFGMKKVKFIMEENGGMLNFDAKEQPKQFLVQLMFPLR